MNIDLSSMKQGFIAARGLCGSAPILTPTCTGSDFISHISCYGLIRAYKKFSISQDSIYHYFLYWKIKTLSIFHKYMQDLGNPYIPANAGFCLVFNNTNLVLYPQLNTVSYNFITIQFMLKILQNQNGVILTSTANNSFSLIIKNSTYCILVGGKIINSFIPIKLNQWIQISLVYNKILRVLYFHHVISKENHQIFKIMINSELWPMDSHLVIGSGFPSNNFIGSIDQLVIWNRTFSFAEIKEMWKFAIFKTEHNVIMLWNFNKGYGHKIQELTTGAISFLDDYSEKLWSVATSSLNTDYFHSSKIFSFDIKFTSLNKEKVAVEHCKKIIFTGKLNSVCYTLHSKAEFHYLSCLEDVSSTGLIAQSMESVVSFASECQALLAHPLWPAQFLCNMFPGRDFPFWFGPDCKSSCIFGVKNKLLNKCDCINGYGGAKCDIKCPGPYSNPCNNHGKCEAETGKCNCSKTWKGDEACGSCSNHWSGTNCDQQVLPNTDISCVAEKNGYVIHFKSEGFNHRIPGIYDLIKSENITIKVKRDSCRSHKMCDNKVMMQLFNNSISIIHQGRGRHAADVYANDLPLQSGFETTLSLLNSHTAIVKHSSKYTYKLEVHSFKLLIKVDIFKDYLTTFIDIPNDQCCHLKFSGECGECQICDINDLEEEYYDDE